MRTGVETEQIETLQEELPGTVSKGPVRWGRVETSRGVGKYGAAGGGDVVEEVLTRGSSKTYRIEFYESIRFP